jgi:Predicted heme/steroid binding protein
MIYFDYITIDELIGDNCNFYRQQKQFTLAELSQYDGKNGRPAYVAFDGIVYDVSNESTFKNSRDIENIAGKDLTEQFNFYNSFYCC